MKKISIFFLFLALYSCRLDAQNDTYNFNSIRMGGGGFVSGIITCPTQKDLIFVRTDVGGAYRWNEADKSWISLNDWVNDSQWTFLGVESMAVDPQQPNRVYMSCGLYNNSPSNILRSTDYGATFKMSNDAFPQINGNGDGRQNGERLAVDPNKSSILFCGFRNGTIYKSPNYGANWSQVNTFATATTTNGNGVCAVAFDKSSGTPGNASQRIFAGVSRTGSNNLFVSEDAGATWNPVAGAINNFMPQRMFVSNGVLFIAYADKAGPGNAGSGALKKYNISTATWTDISPSALPFGSITQDASNPDVLMATTINVYQPQAWTTSGQWGDRMYRTTDGGKTWIELFSTKKIQLSPLDTWNTNISLHWAGSLEIDPFNPERVFVTSGNGLFMTNNISASNSSFSTWFFQVKGIEETVPFGIAPLPNNKFVTIIGDYAGFVHTDLTSVPVGFSNGDGTNLSLAVASAQPNILVRSGGYNFYSDNSAATWTKMNNPSATAKQGNLAISRSGGIILYSPRDTVYKSINKGINWTKLIGFFSGAYIVPDPIVEQKFYTYNPTTAKFYVSADGGSTFNTTAGTLPTGGSKVIRAVPGVEGDVWISSNSNGLCRTKDAGSTFTKISNVVYCYALGFGKAAPDKSFPTIYIWGKVNGGITNSALYRSTDEGATWLRINDDMHQYGGLGNANFVEGDMYKYGRVFMSSWGRGIICGEVATNTGFAPELKIDSKILSVQSSIFSDNLVFTTTIPVQYTIFNTNGTKVESGKCDYSATVGSRLGAGIYVLKVVANNGLFTTKKVVKI
jgi:photosystem II stability/assembly factor-like uncharacterized protein